jgi:hypothetical protein
MTHLGQLDVVKSLTKTLPASFDQMIKDMEDCEQMTDLSVLQHGKEVFKHYQMLRQFLNGEIELSDDWYVPKFMLDQKKGLIENLHTDDIIRQYTVYHDCGKPYCVYRDAETNRNHFPNHAEVSWYVWKSLSNEEVVARLIRDDMFFHTCRSEELAKKIENYWSKQDAVTLLIVAFAEIHANAKMFGGIESQSFKIKRNQLERRGNQLCKLLF